VSLHHLLVPHPARSHNRKRTTYVTDNPQRTNRLGDVHAGERRNTRAAGVQDIVFTLERVLFTAKEEGEFREVLDLVAVDRVLAVPRFGRADPGASAIAMPLSDDHLKVVIEGQLTWY
jgi:hypothetical protein